MLDKVDEFLEQGLWTVGSSISGLGRLIKTGTNPFSPLRAVNNNTCSVEGLSERICRCDGERLVTMKPVGTAEAIAADLRVSVIQHHRNDVGALKGEQPADGATEALGSRSPAHESPPLEGIDPLGDQSLKEISTGLTRGQYGCKDAGALWRLSLFQR